MLMKWIKEARSLLKTKAAEEAKLQAAMAPMMTGAPGMEPPMVEGGMEPPMPGAAMVPPGGPPMPLPPTEM
jgi:hypothetical protein